MFLTAEVTWHPLSAGDCAEACALALELNHSIYDCLYPALALRSEAPYVTADQRFLRVVAASGGWGGAVQGL